MNKRIFLILGIVVIIATLFWYSSVLQSTFYVVVDFFNKLVIYNEYLAVLLFILIAATAALISPFTNVPLIPVAVVIWGPLFTTILLLFGWLVGDILAYVVGRYLGYQAICYIISEEKFDNLINTIKVHTNFLRALFFRLALPAELGYIFGIIRYHFWKYLLITFLAELPFAIVSTYASEAILSGNTIKFFEFMGVLSIVIFIIFQKIHKTMSR